MEGFMTKRTRYIIIASLLSAGMVGVIAALMLPSRSAVARSDLEDIELGYASYGGTGCPDGTARTVLSPDRRTLSILFDHYVAETERSQRLARASCSLAVPIHVPPGLRVSLLRVDYRGYARIPRGGRGSFRAEYFFAGNFGHTIERYFASGYERDFLLTDRNRLVTWSECGESVIARVNSSAIAEKSSPWSDEEAMVIVDTADVDAGILFYLEWREC